MIINLVSERPFKSYWMQCFPDIKTRYSLRKEPNRRHQRQTGVLPEDEKAKLEKVNSEVSGMVGRQ